ncbi:hypothetical protein [Metabacillus fastidiosus]|uniref:hypothetical protein n=1 Tax=Metabacillus fastidiosus TaxID=1458 RepID=UPI002E23541B|nr:hypothetical protein [Metabacillus fastidiosus]
MNDKEKSVLKKILAIIFITPIALGLLLNIPTGWLTIGDEASWVGFFGNYSGGIIGGLVALYIAKTQIYEQSQKQIKNEEEIRYINQLPALIKIKFELERMLSSVKFVIENIEKLAREEKIENLEVAKQMSFRCYKTKEENWSMINLIDDVDFHVDLIEIKNFYGEFQEIMNYDLVKTQQQISVIIDTGGLTDTESMFTLNAKGEELEEMKDLKSSVYKDAIQKNFVGSIENSLRLLNLILKSIEEMKDDRAKIRDSV